jgi:porphobilinogen synthase
MGYPIHRLRRLRRSEAWRRAVRETSLSPADLVYPLFVVGGEGVRNPVGSMPGVEQLSVDQIVREAAEVHGLGIAAVILFGVPADEEKDERGSAGYDPDGLVPRAIRAIKAEVPDLLVWADVCLCEYTSHGHCGVLSGTGEVLNDETLDLLGRAAVAYAEAGADAVAPSDMMDGRVGAIRAALDDQRLNPVPIVAYAAKYASAYYGPFREAAHSTPAFGDRRGYQMDPGNVEEALREVELDIEEGADVVMVKPAGPYLDVIRRVKDTFGMPTAAYQVSGEFALIRAAGEKGWIDEARVAMESVLGIKRAGADLILTYFAKDLARALRQEEGR